VSQPETIMGAPDQESTNAHVVLLVDDEVIWCQAGTVPPSIGWMIRRNHLQPRRSRTTFQRLRNCRKLLVRRPRIEAGTAC
jgi:hypothetical protein